MRISIYLKEKGYIIILSLLLSFIIFIFLFALHTNIQVIFILVFLLWFFLICVFAIEYGRKSSFYRQLDRMLKGLDKKYLITELLQEPSFIEGKILYETMHMVDKSMAEHVNLYKLAQNDYKEYIEMWVHEIKTPLAAAKLILQNNSDKKSNRLLEELDKVEDYIEQALYYARSKNPEKDYIIKELSLMECLHKVIRRHAYTFIYKKIAVQLDQIDVQVFSDPKWLAFILHQIISNAVQYTPSKTGKIKIYCTQQENAISLHIEDNGIGIASNEIDRIFDKGFTGTNGRVHESATGMGLYLCKMLCQKLYLNIFASSTSNVGTTITIVFPIRTSMLLT